MVLTYTGVFDRNINFYSKHTHFLSYIHIYSGNYEILTAHLNTNCSFMHCIKKRHEKCYMQLKYKITVSFSSPVIQTEIYLLLLISFL